MFHAASAQKYVDASTLTIIGRTCPMEGHPYYRVDTTRYRFDNATIRHYCGYPAGVAVLFTTDSRRIEARWTTAPRNYGWNMTPVLQRGMDLYVRENGVWTMAGAARPGLQDRHASTIVEHMDGQPKECMLYLPAWSELLTLEIGVDEGASVTPLESPYKHRVIVFGSSVTHGASASRPGMTYPARMSRMTGIEFVNLGYSGNCMLQPEFARLLAETDADAFLFDAFSNPSPKMIRERLDAFVATLVKAHPDKPLIFMQTHWHAAGNFNNEAAQFLREMLRLMNIDAQVLANVSEEDGVRLRIESSGMGVLIGHRGETLDAIQYLTSLHVNRSRKEHGFTRITVDTEGYRDRREETLARLARKVASQVRSTGRARTLEPMNPYERRVLHATLQNNPYVTTYSEGEEPNRRVVIAPKGREE